MENLLDIYGHCIIPKGTILFRGHKSKSFDDCMFFATKHWVAKTFGTLQVWKTTKEIKVVFLVEYLCDNSHTFSALPTLHNNIFPSDSNPDFTDLDIKHWDIPRRNKLIRKLFDDYNISGWFTSLENNAELEICLFDKQANSQQLILIDICKGKNKTYLKDSLQKLKVFPTENFYKETEKKLKTAYRRTYKLYIKMINAWIKDGVEKGGNRLHLKHTYSNLRTKLKI